MHNSISWDIQEKILILKGELNRDTVLILWEKRKKLLNGILFLDVSNIERVDSAGISLILHFFQHQKALGYKLQLIGANRRFRTLIILYKLNKILICLTSSINKK